MEKFSQGNSEEVHRLEESVTDDTVQVRSNRITYKDSLLEISHTLKAPIFKCEGKYAVVSAGASYEYKE